MSKRWLIAGGMGLVGALASLEGLARLLSGTSDLYRGAKHPWLSGFFMIFGPYAPYASAILSLGIGALFIFLAYSSFRTIGGEEKPLEGNSQDATEIENLGTEICLQQQTPGKRGAKSRRGRKGSRASNLG